MYTVGHSTRSLETLLALLRAHGVGRLVDVRTIPRSRRHPWFNREALPGPLADAGVTYVHMPGLGGLRKPQPDSVNTAWRNPGFVGYADHMQTPEFAASVAELIEGARGTPTAIMCAEAVPWRCHRSLLADALVVHGIDVRHILDATRADPHTLTTFARVDGLRITYTGARQGRLAL